MALDLNNYDRKDGASASNVYYGYVVNKNDSDSSKVFSIRKITTVAGVETSTWANGGPQSYSDSWTDRAYCFTAPSGSLGLTYTVSSMISNISWTGLTGVSKYTFTAISPNGYILQKGGAKLEGFFVDRTYGDVLFNVTNYSQSHLSSGTYSITVTAVNVAGSSSSTINIFIP
jgi:hypothetical protein